MAFLPTMLASLSKCVDRGYTILPIPITNFYLQPDPKQTKKTFNQLTRYFSYLNARTRGPGQKKKGGDGQGDDYVGEYQTLMEQELFDFVLFEVPWIV
jgi:V-type H+-transporting ATPase subunit C